MRNQIRAAFWLLSRNAAAKASFVVALLYPLLTVVDACLSSLFGGSLSMIMNDATLPTLGLLGATFMVSLAAASLACSDQSACMARGSVLAERGRRDYVVSRVVVVEALAAVLVLWCLAWGWGFTVFLNVANPSGLVIETGGSDARHTLVGYVARCFAYPALALFVAWVFRARGRGGSWVVAICVAGTVVMTAWDAVATVIMWLAGPVLGLVSNTDALHTATMRASISWCTTNQFVATNAWVCGLAVAYVAVALVAGLRVWARRSV